MRVLSLPRGDMNVKGQTMVRVKLLPLEEGRVLDLILSTSEVCGSAQLTHSEPFMLSVRL